MNQWDSQGGDPGKEREHVTSCWHEWAPLEVGPGVSKTEVGQSLGVRAEKVSLCFQTSVLAEPAKFPTFFPAQLLNSYLS